LVQRFAGRPRHGADAAQAARLGAHRAMIRLSTAALLTSDAAMLVTSTAA